MMSRWVRLWEDMPTDPKWRVVARRSGRPLAEVLAVFVLMMTSADAQSGSLENWDDEDAGAALDIDAEAVFAIRSAMQGKTLDGDTLSGWEKRQPKRQDDHSTERVRAFRERKAAIETQVKRNETQGNAPEEIREEEIREERESHSARGARRPTKGTRLPSDWKPSEADHAAASAMGFSTAQALREFERFRDYWVAKPGQGGVKLDWQATLRNWLRTSADKLGIAPPTSTGPPPSEPMPKFASLEEQHRWMRERQLPQLRAILNGHDASEIRGTVSASHPVDGAEQRRDEGVLPHRSLA